MTLAHILLPELGKYTLDRLCKQFGVVNEHHHRACDDAAATAEIFVKMIKMIKEKGITTIHELNEAGEVYKIRRDSRLAIRIRSWFNAEI